MVSPFLFSDYAEGKERFFEAYAKGAFGLRVFLVVPVVVYILRNPHGLGVSAESTTLALCVEMII